MEVPLMRFRSLAFLLPLVAVPAAAATVHLKVKAETAVAGQPAKLTVKALSRVPVSLPAEPTVFVDEGQGFKARPDLHCNLAAGPTVRLEADREATLSCSLPLSGTPRVRLGFKLGESVSTSNVVTLETKASGEALASK
jgi:hypothetical protein